MYSFINFLNGIFIAGNYMEVGTQFYSVVSDRIGYILEIVNSKFFRDYINNLISGRNIGFILIGNKLIDIFLSDHIFTFMPYNISSCLKAFDMMARNSNIHFFNFQVGI